VSRVVDARSQAGDDDDSLRGELTGNLPRHGSTFGRSLARSDDRNAGARHEAQVAGRVQVRDMRSVTRNE
jgi:hypothetical protein